MANNSGIIIGIVAIIVIIGAIAVFGLSYKSGAHASTSAYTTIQNTNTTTVPAASRSGNYSVPVMMTDPPQVPAGAQALVVTYSSVMAHTSGGQNSGWVNVAGSGSVNLLAVVNSSQVIGNANISANSTINLIRFEITSANITVNGTTYNVTLPNSNLTIAVTGKTKVNSSTGVLVDFAPVVHAVYNDNSTAFVMAPAAKATVVTNVSAGIGVGARIGLSASSMADIEDAAPNITITNATITVNGNMTTVSVTVKDNSNSSVVLNNIFIRGQQNATVTQSANINASVMESINGELNGNSMMMNESSGMHADALGTLGLNIEHFDSLGFVVMSNGTLEVPTGVESLRSSGYTLAAGSSATLSFNGVVSYNSGEIQSTPETGSQQQITVIGNEGARASTAATVT
ncbi:MAG: DUF4382 domain-containing protein [Candidatus Micrarchaeota archaeon]|nr:DUF4382 domain-containing protein [Candidatus Micrarchaeota archaeon]